MFVMKLILSRDSRRRVRVLTEVEFKSCLVFPPSLPLPTFGTDWYVPPLLNVGVSHKSCNIL